MKVAGEVRMHDEDYIIMIDYQKAMTYYYLLSQYHSEDREALIFGGSPKKPIKRLYHYLAEKIDMDYLIGAVKRKNIGGELYYYGVYDDLLEIIESMRVAVTYSFKPSDILRSPEPAPDSSGLIVKDFAGRDDTYSIEYLKVSGVLQRLSFSSHSIKINLSESRHKFPNVRDINPNMVLLNVKKKSRLYYSSIKSIDFESVIQNMDTSWYFEDIDGKRVFKKRYLEITNEQDFEREIILGLKHEIEKARLENNLPVLVSDDTETTGLDVYNIPKDIQSTVVAIPFAFRDDEAFTIFTDMECFQNISIDYVKKRLSPFLARDLLKDDLITIDTLEGSFSFKRSEIFLVGHNTMFDIRAHAVHDFPIWFDADTMQMSFNLDPFLTKGRNGLKEITHFLFNHDTPELSEILGKGNEDKFRNLSDLRVAVMYGCADADYTRKVFRTLRNLYKECEGFHRKDLFAEYLKQDVPLMNVCAIMDFNGLRIDKNHFIEAGEGSQEDMRIITEFTYKYVGRVIEANNYLAKKKALIDLGKDPSSLPYPDLENSKPYIFKFAGNELIDALYTVLNYPVLVRTEPSKSKSGGSNSSTAQGRPATNKTAMKYLMKRLHDVPVPVLEKDIVGHDGKPLIIASEFNKYKYPVAYLVSLLGPRKKEYDSYFKPFVEDSYGDRLCKSTSFSRIDTRRISNPIQTIKGSLKYHILPHDDSFALCDFDMSQVELRIMASLAHDLYMIDRMADPEVDSHTEVAAQMFFKAAYLITKFERTYAKQVNFGYPYGLMAFSMCERIFGDTSDAHMYETRKIIDTFEKVKIIIVDFLNHIRDETLMPVEIPPLLRDYLRIGDTIPVGVVRNLQGFYKLFQLKYTDKDTKKVYDLDNKSRERIRRQAGNFPIQGFAAELFRMVITFFYLACERKGWNQKGWIVWHMLIHDELLFSFKRGHIHPAELCKVLYENCTLRLKHPKSVDELALTLEEMAENQNISVEQASKAWDEKNWKHTIYYIGINIGNSWGQCKDDASELPVRCVQNLIQRYDAGEFSGEWVEDPKAWADAQRQAYVVDRIGQVIKEYYPDISANLIDSGKVMADFTNYTVRKYIFECFKPLWSAALDINGKPLEEDVFDACLARWAINYFKDQSITFITRDRKVVLESSLLNKTKTVKGKSVPLSFEELFEGKEIIFELQHMNVFEEVQEDSYYREIDWDLSGDSNPYYVDYDSDEGEENFETFFDSSKGSTFESMLKRKESAYNNVKIQSDKITLNVSRADTMKKIDTYFRQNNLYTKDGKSIFFKTSSAITKGGKTSLIDFTTIDNIIDQLKGGNLSGTVQ